MCDAYLELGVARDLLTGNESPEELVDNGKVRDVPGGAGHLLELPTLHDQVIHFFLGAPLAEAEVTAERIRTDRL